ncbi:hypothetical protein N2W54_005758 [Lotmaria passim]
MSTQPNVAASTFAAALPIATDNDSSNKQQLLSGFQFSLLCLLVAVFYYISLFISMHAVGESTASLGAPFAAAAHIVSDVGSNIVRSINRRRNRTQPGAVSYEEVDDNDDLFLGVNQPATGVPS